MIKVAKKNGKIVKAYRLGDNNKVIDKLIEERKIIPLSDGTYEVKSQEAIHANTGKGQIAKSGDYIKVDSEGYPYPNDCQWFEENHMLVNNDEYVQVPKELNAWDIQQPMCKEIEFLIENKGLVITEESFVAPLWGTLESAPRDSYIIFYEIVYDEKNNVVDAEFNFVVRGEFEKTYNVI
mgnify:CR=1 FL=1